MRTLTISRMPWIPVSTTSSPDFQSWRSRPRRKSRADMFSGWVPRHRTYIGPSEDTTSTLCCSLPCSSTPARHLDLLYIASVSSSTCLFFKIGDTGLPSSGPRSYAVQPLHVASVWVTGPGTFNKAASRCSLVRPKTLHHRSTSHENQRNSTMPYRSTLFNTSAC